MNREKPELKDECIRKSRMATFADYAETYTTISKEEFIRRVRDCPITFSPPLVDPVEAAIEKHMPPEDPSPEYGMRTVPGRIGVAAPGHEENLRHEEPSESFDAIAR